MTDATFKLDDAQAQAMFKRLGNAGRNVTHMLDGVVYALTERARLGFKDQQDPWGGAWQPLAASTIKARRDNGRGGVSILRDTGALLNSLIGSASGNTGEINIGFSDRPATAHQFGTDRIPARKMLPIRDGGQVDMPQIWRDEIIDVMTSHVEGAL